MFTETDNAYWHFHWLRKIMTWKDEKIVLTVPVHDIVAWQSVPIASSSSLSMRVPLQFSLAIATVRLAKILVTYTGYSVTEYTPTTYEDL